jgi:hypothetical protein
MPRRSRDRPIEAVPRRLLTRAEAAASLGMSVAHFGRFVQPYVKVVPCGQLLLIEPGRSIVGCRNMPAWRAPSHDSGRVRGSVAELTAVSDHPRTPSGAKSLPSGSA